MMTPEESAAVQALSTHALANIELARLAYETDGTNDDETGELLANAGVSLDMATHLIVRHVR